MAPIASKTRAAAKAEKRARSVTADDTPAPSKKVKLVVNTDDSMVKTSAIYAPSTESSLSSPISDTFSLPSLSSDLTPTSTPVITSFSNSEPALQTSCSIASLPSATVIVPKSQVPPTVVQTQSTVPPNATVSPYITPQLVTILPELPTAIPAGIRSYIDGPLAARLNHINCHSETRDTTYSISKLPFNLQFGKGIGKPSRYVQLNGRQVKVWLLGEVNTVNFGTVDSHPDRVNISIIPLLSRDSMLAFNLLRSLERLELTDSDDGDYSYHEEPIYAGKWMSSNKGSTVSPFLGVYDATTQLVPADISQKFDAYAVKQGDVVLVECAINRYRQKPKEGSANTSYTGWRYWVTQFELNTVHVVLSAPAAVGYSY